MLMPIQILCLNRPTRRGFTLIELLIVVSIILILLAIGLPHFFSAINRSKLTRAHGDIRSLSIALEAYFLDWGAYPCESEAEYLSVDRFEAGLTWLTSPIAYMTALPEDPYEGKAIEPICYELGGVEIPFEERPGGLLAMWVLHSYGPDSPIEENRTSRPNYKIHDNGKVCSYSPTNGMISPGDIAIYGGDPRYMGVVVDFADPLSVKQAAKPGIDIDGSLYLGRFPPHFE
jgi:type II secretion system protein G